MYIIRSTLIFLLSTTCIVAPFSRAVADSGYSKQLIIEYKPGMARRVLPAQLQQLVVESETSHDLSMRFIRRLGANGIVVELPDATTPARVQDAIDALSSDPAIAYAQVDQRVYPAFVPNDPQYPSQWYLYEAFGINAPAAWDRSTGSSNIVIAVLDSGALPHFDLNPARILAGYDFISDDFTANDAQPGRDPDNADTGDAVQEDECGDGDSAADSSWHGLSVMAIMAAESDNGSLIAGIDFSARILPLRVIGKCGGLVSDIVDAMRWAAGLPVNGVPLNTTPANVINLSLSGPGPCSQTQQSAINDVNAAGAVVVVATGNDDKNAALESPGNCQGVITVGATTRGGSRASFVNFGAPIDISAPSGDGFDAILTLSNTGKTVPEQDTVIQLQGTSFSTAQVSAVAALMFAVNSSLTPAEVGSILCATAQPFPAGSTCTPALCGTGILNVDAALAAAANPSSVLPANCSMDAETIVPSVSTSGGGGGGGCTLGSSQKYDPFWLILLLVAGYRGYALHRKPRNRQEP